jgi:hypothetical protein
MKRVPYFKNLEEGCLADIMFNLVTEKYAKNDILQESALVSKARNSSLNGFSEVVLSTSERSSRSKARS